MGINLKKLAAIMMAAVMVAGIISGCGQNETAASASSDNQAATEATAEPEDSAAETDENAADEAAGGEVTIVYTNDIHSYIDNVVKDDEGNITGDGLRFSKIAAMVQDMEAEGKNVALVDAGDEFQGDIYGAMDEGISIVDIMNNTGYDIATPGNHDFDYGVFQLLRLVGEANYTYITCNFHSYESREILMPATHVMELGGKKVAFVGITTPSTITSSTPAYFQNENGEFIYYIDGCEKIEDLYTSVQNAIDSVRDEADYVIALGHVGVGMEAKKDGSSSEDIIANVSGLDAFIDGHSHTTIVGDIVKDKDGRDVTLTQTGYYLNAVGVMTIAEDGTISTELVNDYDREDEKVAQLENDLIDSVNAEMEEKIGTLENTLYICNPENDKDRRIRAQEMNLGDFTADSVYWFFNDRLEIDCDIAIANGGGIRAQLEKGDLTYKSAKMVEPFGNMICLISATGQQIVDALEMGVNVVGEWNDEWNSPAENGGFLQVAGLTYTIDSTIDSSIETDDNGMFKAVNGDYRVKDVKVYNRENGKYEPIDLEKEYKFGGINYILRNSGNGCSMFADDDLVVDYVGMDYVIFAEYVKNFTAGEDGMAVVNTKNSPLNEYEGYLLDYENPYGSGRISIIAE